MTYKDYVIIARVLSEVREDIERVEPRITHAEVVDYAARRLATAMELENPRFKRDVFLQECGVA